MSDGRGRRRLTATVTDIDVVRQRALLVGSIIDDDPGSLDELARLVDTAGSDPVGRYTPRPRRPDPATFLGPGQVRRLADESEALDIDVVVFDDDLAASQQRNLQERLERDVVDRSAVILDIFAQHATSKAGMLQVELALLRYHLPRLRGRGTQLSRQAGGIGTRGPGETKLETDRRRIERRITKIEQDLAKVRSVRATQRKARTRRALPTVALVGYTNAGKSTLLNRLADADVLVEDRLFSTLDATVRKVRLPDGRTVVMSDTVGFIRRIPHDLIEAFRSTLEEVTGADLLLLVVDGSEPGAELRLATVREVLADLGADEIPELVVVNKSDAGEPEPLRRAEPDAVAVSALTGDGVDKLLDRIADVLAPSTVLVTFDVPYGRGDLLAALHREGDVMSEEPGDGVIAVTVRLSPDRAAEFRSAIG